MPVFVSSAGGVHVSNPLVRANHSAPAVDSIRLEQRAVDRLAGDAHSRIEPLADVPGFSASSRRCRVLRT